MNVKKIKSTILNNFVNFTNIITKTMENIDLNSITASQLLDKIGAGNHKPGSGSAAALQGMISAKLILTVIQLTDVEKRQERYKNVLPQLREMQNRIDNYIYPELFDFFEKDSIQFGTTINIRNLRNEEKNIFKKNTLKRLALAELKTSIDIPLKIADLCIELAEISDFVFDNAFKSARGDSQVALNGAVSALAGCISIIKLNLLSFHSDEYDWVEKIILNVHNLEKKFIKLNQKANTKITILENEFKIMEPLYREINNLLKTTKNDKFLTESKIENYAKDIQNIIWKHRKRIWINDTPNSSLDILKPEIILAKALGFDFHISNLNTISSIDNISETAGIIDLQDKIVIVSDQFSKPIQNFTAAHELGHALFHDKLIMHRDIPINESETNSKRSIKEKQADKFASYFLMPENQIKTVFDNLFSTLKFKIDQDTTFALTKSWKYGVSEFRKECKNLRGLSRKLASSESYQNQSFRSMSDVFGVSIEAMAIRLEELELVEF